jgi:hypothetical protein
MNSLNMLERLTRNARLNAAVLLVTAMLLAALVIFALR